ncbi:acyl CoA:acetate/3-ketoacid CoA transferase [Salibacterium salarium]|uniref:Acyl CoA:acetate/3-ketoacid CoA transferase n=1 Tax=Salibacterium salarium TaxID=284579 RepID=A0A428N506_9BACI|nr:CoA-transferase [Salibacterium salarium]RSL33560.1 acyl CoA:acetate/3-ketoacid CoA transferase [Salibacterium salarium]
MTKIDKKIDPTGVLDVINDGDTLALSGFSLIGACEDVLQTIESSYLENNSPKNLTLLHAAGHSDRENGIERLAHKGLVTKIIGSHWGLAPKWASLISENEVEAHCLSQGQLTHLFRDMAAGKPGTFSKSGLGTFIDPRLEGGRVNQKAKNEESLVDLIHLKEEEYLFYNQVPIDVCVLRGTTADEFGNITMEEEALKLDSLSVAQATKRFNGKVIIQVKNYVKRGTLPAKDVVIPGTCVDHIVVTENAEKNHRQTASTAFNAIYTGALKAPNEGMETQHLNARKIIGRRAVKELYPEAVVNLGTGIPGDTVGPVCSEEGILDEIHLTIESGAIGGIPLGGTDFGIARSPEAILEHSSQFDYYNGRGVDVTFMGGAEIDADGNVNVSKFGKVTTGCGGFIDITQNAQKVVFCFTFTAGSLKTDIYNHELDITQEGKFKKFVDKLHQITFSGEYAKNINQTVLYITERAVFRHTQEGIRLMEIAPGIDLQKDILDQMDFEPLYDDFVKTMDKDIFGTGKMDYKTEFLEKKQPNQ